ncbi:dihydrofolate reductase family protein [Shimia aestuarii]|uniref:Dihydrofolate reductase n=1 Tax=Shimia aestuarii TaxID=254406 RepID=A0A1I4K188_9RHOB|nr:dihydrofolate reductase family protein [Shimia aestuarii]SFL72538.1 Dihydrofolate reductase [Shimia aestuarii]
MQPVIYDVAVSIDGFICGPEGDISQFAHTGPVVDDYMSRLTEYSAAIMGRHSYEFGYRFGLQPGQNPYPHMKTVVFSNTMETPAQSDIHILRNGLEHHVRDLQRTASGPIYLCGGGKLAGALLNAGRIQRLRLKRAPILLGSGVGLFEGVKATPRLTLLEEKPYAGGCLFQEFRIES